MRNMAEIQDEIAEKRAELEAIRDQEKAAQSELQILLGLLMDGCSHPQEFRKRHFIERDEPLGSDKVWYTCNICGKRFDEA